MIQKPCLRWFRLPHCTSPWMMSGLHWLKFLWKWPSLIVCCQTRLYWWRKHQKRVRTKFDYCPLQTCQTCSAQQHLIQTGRMC